MELAKNISNFFDYVKALVGAMLNQQDSIHLHSDDWKRTIYIPCDGISAIDFDLSNDLKKELIESGASGVRKYFNRE